MPQSSEYQECCWLAEYLNILISQGKVIAYTHIPNETFTKSWGVKMKNKKMGVHKGVPDYMIVLKGKIVFIEMKKVGARGATDEQMEWLKALNNTGAKAYVCFGFEQAKLMLDSEL